jgi:hypothetical protein
MTQSYSELNEEKNSSGCNFEQKNIGKTLDNTTPYNNISRDKSA